MEEMAVEMSDTGLEPAMLLNMRSDASPTGGEIMSGESLYDDDDDDE
jgi:hypothetical protein